MLTGYRQIAAMAVVVVGALAMGGCSWWSRGYLSDYSQLEPQAKGLGAATGDSLQFDSPKLDGYTRFIVEPVEIRFYSGEEVKTPLPVLRDLTNYAHNAVVASLVPRYAVVTTPGPRIARLRVIITDLNADSKPLRDMSRSMVAGMGLGGATMEAEMVDVNTGEQLFALIQPQSGGRFTLSNVTNWGQAKSVVDTWSQNLRSNIDKARAVAAGEPDDLEAKGSKP